MTRPENQDLPDLPNGFHFFSKRGYVAHGNPRTCSFPVTGETRERLLSGDYTPGPLYLGADEFKAMAELFEPGIV